MSKDEQETVAAEAPTKSRKKLMIIVIAAVLVIGGGAGAYFMFFASKTPAAPKPGVVVALDAVTINLAEGHYLKLAFALQATAKAAEKPDGSKALDLAIAQYSGMPAAELATDKGRESAKKELLGKIEKAYEDEVMDIYFTQFVTQ